MYFPLLSREVASTRPAPEVRFHTWMLQSFRLLCESSSSQTTQGGSAIIAPMPPIPGENLEIVVSLPVVKSSRPMPLSAAELNSPMAAPPASPPVPNLTPLVDVTLRPCSAWVHPPGIAPLPPATRLALAARPRTHH